jgi:hypothetical protein
MYKCHLYIINTLTCHISIGIWFMHLDLINKGFSLYYVSCYPYQYNNQLQVVIHGDVSSIYPELQVLSNPWV